MVPEKTKTKNRSRTVMRKYIIIQVFESDSFRRSFVTDGDVVKHLSNINIKTRTVRQNIEIYTPEWTDLCLLWIEEYLRPLGVGVIFSYQRTCKVDYPYGQTEDYTTVRPVKSSVISRDLLLKSFSRKQSFRRCVV